MRRPRMLLVVALLIAAAALLVRWPVLSKVWWILIEDLGHVPLFALLTVALFGVFRARAIRSIDLTPHSLSGSAAHPGRVPRQGFPRVTGVIESREPGGVLTRAANVRTYVATALSAAVLAFGSELAQIPVGRNASWIDLRNDAIGAAIALALLAAFDRRLALGRTLRVGLVALALAAVVLVALPLVNAARAYYYRAALFPRLADFSTDRDAYWTIGLGARRDFSPGALTVEFLAERYPGVTWFEPQPDWRGYQWLMLDVENPNDAPVELTLRVHDQQHRSGFTDRFNHKFKLAPNERRQVRVALDDIEKAPRNRRMDLAHIAGVSVFRSGSVGPRRMTIYALGLEGASP